MVLDTIKISNNASKFGRIFRGGKIEIIGSTISNNNIFSS